MSETAFEGGCACGALRYRFTVAPLIVHCCHCRYCQRETGSAFVINALVETTEVKVERGAAETVVTPSASGKGQQIVRCPTCRVAVWNHYHPSGELLAFVRVGTLDDPDRLPPDIHLHTASKQPWVILPPGAQAVDEFYDVRATWSPEARARFKAARDAAAK